MGDHGHNRHGPKRGELLCPFRDMGPKLGSCAPLGEGELGPYLTECAQGRGLSAYQVSSWFVQPFGHSARTSQTDRQDRQTDGQTMVW